MHKFWKSVVCVYILINIGDSLQNVWDQNILSFFHLLNYINLITGVMRICANEEFELMDGSCQH